MAEKNAPILFALDTLDTLTKAEAGSWMSVLQPNGTPALSPSGVPVRILYCGSDSAPYQEAAVARARLAVKKVQASQGTPNKGPEITDGIAETVAVLTAVARGWEGVETPKSTKESPDNVPFTATNHSALMMGYPAVREQADRFIVNRSNFFLKPVES